MITTRVDEGKPYDIAIVGAGPAGVSLAISLAQKGVKNIALIESGGLGYNVPAHNLSLVNAEGDHQTNYYFLHSQRRLGGTSSVWSGLCTVMEERSFMQNEWPIRYQELLPYYAGAAQILDLPSAAATHPQTAVDDTGNLFYKPFYLSKPTRFGAKYEAQLRASKQIDLIIYATCAQLLEEDNYIQGLRVRQGNETDQSSQKVIRADKFVLASGGLGNPRLLQLSSIGQALPIGSFLMDHPHLFGATKIEISKARFDALRSNHRVIHGFTLSDKVCRKEQMLNFSVSFAADDETSSVLHGERTATYTSMIDIRAEMPALETNNVTLDSTHQDYFDDPFAKIKFRFDFEKAARKGWEIFARELLASGMGRAYALPDTLRVAGGGHILGTTKMGDHAGSSVVDKDCKVHGLQNLYVAGSSLFPAGAAANPTFTIVALALRLSDHLLKETPF